MSEGGESACDLLAPALGPLLSLVCAGLASALLAGITLGFGWLFAGRRNARRRPLAGPWTAYDGGLLSLWRLSRQLGRTEPRPVLCFRTRFPSHRRTLANRKRRVGRADHAGHRE